MCVHMPQLALEVRGQVLSTIGALGIQLKLSGLAQTPLDNLSPDVIHVGSNTTVK